MQGCFVSVSDGRFLMCLLKRPRRADRVWTPVTGDTLIFIHAYIYTAFPAEVKGLSDGADNNDAYF